MKATKKTTMLGFCSHKMLVAAIALFSVLPLFGKQFIPLQEATDGNTSFKAFLSELKKVNSIEKSSFGKPYDFIDNDEKYTGFLPKADDECRCKSGSIRWQKGSYVEYENYIVVLLQRYCPDYQDGNSKWFVENDGMDYMLITYSSDGKMLDYKKVGHDGTKAYDVNMTTAKNGLVVEQKILDDCSLLYQYKDLVYTVAKHEYTLRPDGKISKRNIGNPQKEVEDVMSKVEQFSFEKFMSYFEKSDDTSIDYTLFTGRGELPFESCRSLLPDTLLDPNCWPRNIRWCPGRYIENKNGISFFIVRDCSTPQNRKSIC